MKRAILILGVVLALGLASLPGHAVNQDVRIVGFRYVDVGNPQTLNITAARNDTLVIQNLDPVPHSLTTGSQICGTATTKTSCDTDSFGGALGGAATLLATRSLRISGIAVPGTYSFFCTVHGAALMSGTIVVS